MPLCEAKSAVEPLPIPRSSAGGNLLIKDEEFYAFETADIFEFLEESESDPAIQAEQDFPVIIAESPHPQAGGSQLAVKKRNPSQQKLFRSGGHIAVNSHPSSGLRPRNSPDKPQSDPPPSSSLPTDEPAPIAAALPDDAIAQDPSVSRDVSPERSSSEKTAALGGAISIFPSLLNAKVQEFVSFFQGRAESFFSRSLARSQAYEEMMKRIFREKNLPEDLFYLALIESGYNPTALSRAKASGIWQFIGQTAKRFGLRVDKWVDERRDPEKSTLAAAEYLKTLHGLFNNWDLATASYNAGEGKLLAAMKKAQSDDFWEISNHRYLKQETKKYVPMFLAAMTIAKEPQKYGFANIEYHPPLVYEKVAVPPATSLALVAKAAESDLAEIRSLNPALLREKTPPNLPHFEVNLPSGKKEVFEKNFPSLSRPSASKNAYRVRSGDTLSRVAKIFNVSVQELCEANALKPHSLLKAGSKLRIPQ